MGVFAEIAIKNSAPQISRDSRCKIPDYLFLN